MKVGELKDSIGPNSTLKSSKSSAKSLKGDCKYLVSVKTMDSFTADSSGPIFMKIIGENGETSSQQLAHPREPEVKEQFQRGQEESYFIQGPDIGPITGYTVHNKSDDNWIADSITVAKVDTELRPIGKVYHQEKDFPLTLEDEPFTSGQKQIKKIFDHTTLDEAAIADLINKKLQRENPNGVNFKVRVSMAKNLTSPLPENLSFKMIVNSSSESSKPITVNMAPEAGLLYEYSAFGTKIDKVKNVEFVTEEYLREEWFDYVEVDYDTEQYFLLANLAASDDFRVQFEPGYKYFIRINALEEFLTEPFISLRLIGTRTTSPVIADAEFYDKKFKSNVLQMIVNDEQVGRLMSIEINNKTRKAFTVQGISIDRCNTAEMDVATNAFKYDWEPAYQYE